MSACGTSSIRFTTPLLWFHDLGPEKPVRPSPSGPTQPKPIALLNPVILDHRWAGSWKQGQGRTVPLTCVEESWNPKAGRSAPRGSRQSAAATVPGGGRASPCRRMVAT